MLGRFLLVGLGYSLAHIRRADGARTSGGSRMSRPPEPEHAAARSAFASLNLSLLNSGQAAGTAPPISTIDDIARIYGGALSAAENAQEAILEAWARFTQNRVLPVENDRMSIERQRLGAAAISQVLGSPDVAGALATIRQQTVSLKAAAGRMKSAVKEREAAAAAVTAVDTVAALATSFNGG